MDSISNKTINRKCVIVIPAYQPSDKLTALAESLSEADFDVVVVNDGSDSQYDYIWDSLIYCRAVLKHDINKGKGAALKTAFSYIKENIPTTDCIVTMDADGQHLEEDMLKLVEKSFSNPGSLILGARSFSKDVPIRSRIGNKLTRLVSTVLCSLKISDTQTGLRAFSPELLDYMLNVSGERYEYEMNMLLGCRQAGITIIEVPITTLYLDSKNSSSHFNGLRDSIRIYRNIFKFASSSFVCFLADYLLFILLSAIFGNSEPAVYSANIIARLCSAALNYMINSKAVFHNNKPHSKSLPQYIILAAFILLGNTLLLSFLTQYAGIIPSLAKIITEAVLFTVSFLVQALFIFKKEKKGV